MVKRKVEPEDFHCPLSSGRDKIIIMNTIKVIIIVLLAHEQSCGRRALEVCSMT